MSLSFFRLHEPEKNAREITQVQSSLRRPSWETQWCDFLASSRVADLVLN